VIKTESMHPPGVAVRLLIFSGRPDPTWTLEDAEISDLTRLLKDTIGRDAIHAAPPGGIGYRGFLVRSDRPFDQLPPEFTVFRGVVTVRTGATMNHWRDSGALEGWLLRQAVDLGHRDVLEHFGGQEVQRLLRQGPQSP
jgi:hypothetical protein